MDRSLSPNVLLDFFLTFARCEFALKTGGFARCGAQRGGKRGDSWEAQANWDTFANKLAPIFQSRLEPDIEAACARLIDASPWELVMRAHLVRCGLQCLPALRTGAFARQRSEGL